MQQVISKAKQCRISTCHHSTVASCMNKNFYSVAHEKRRG